MLGMLGRVGGWTLGGLLGGGRLRLGLGGGDKLGWRLVGGAVGR